MTKDGIRDKVTHGLKRWYADLLRQEHARGGLPAEQALLDELDRKTRGQSNND